MTKHQTGIAPKRINWEKGIFESCGVYYFANLESLSYPRLIRWLELTPSVVYGRKYFEIVKFIHDLRLTLTTGDLPFKESYFQAVSEITAFDQLLIENAADPAMFIDDVMRMAALMINTKDEDLTTINEAHMEEKINNWKKDCVPDDFFFFVMSRIPGFKQTLQELSKELNESIVRSTRS